MNKKQLVVLWVAIGVIILMALVPPWKLTGISSKKVGYHLIFLPPEKRFASVVIDSTRLLIQVLAVGLVGGGLLFSLKDRSKSP